MPKTKLLKAWIPQHRGFTVSCHYLKLFCIIDKAPQHAQMEIIGFFVCSFFQRMQTESPSKKASNQDGIILAGKW